MSILVTGASGYLGSNIVKLCQRNNLDVIGLSRNRLNGSGLLSCDLLNSSDTSKIIEEVNPDTVIHCAAIVPKNQNGYSNSMSALESLKMTKNLLQAHPKYVVFCSSMTIYDEDTVLPAREESVGQRLSFYAESKLQAEKYVAQSAVSSTILRLPGLFGSPRKSGLIYNVISSFIADKSLELPGVFPIWSAMHVNDAAEYCLAAATVYPVESRTINVGYPGRMSIPKLVEHLAKTIGVESPAMSSGPMFEMNLSRLEVLGYAPASFEQRLLEFIDWVRKEQK